MTLADYFRSLPLIARERHFNDPWVCQALLRSLTPLARLYVLRLAGVGAAGLERAVVDAWPQPTAEARAKHAAALEQLEQLDIVLVTASPQMGARYALQLTFCNRLMESLRAGEPPGGGGTAAAAADALGPDKKAPTAAELRAHARQRWETLLLHVLSPQPGEYGDKPLNGPFQLKLQVTLNDLLSEAGLIEVSHVTAEGTPAAWATSAGGRAYVLKPAAEQVWRFVLAYFAIAKKAQSGGRGGGAVAEEGVSPASRVQTDALLSFPLRLGFLRSGRDYAFSSLTATEQAVVCDLQRFGLLYQRVNVDNRSSQKEQPLSRRYYTTPLASLLLSGGGDDGDGGGGGGGGGGYPAGSERRPGDADGFLVVETNFRLYLYTGSPLWRTAVQSFAQLLYVLPNLLVAQLTRESILSARAHGLRVDTIVAFLRRAAHGRMHDYHAKNPDKGLLPETVVDQLNLWAREKERVHVAPAVVFDLFESLELFDEMKQHAEDMRALLWSRRGKESDEGTGLAQCALAVSVDAKAEMKQYSNVAKQRILARAAGYGGKASGT